MRLVSPVCPDLITFHVATIVNMKLWQVVTANQVTRAMLVHQERPRLMGENCWPLLLLLGGLGGNKMLTRPHGIQSQTVWTLDP